MKTYQFIDSGREFTAKLVEPGDRYGRNDCLTFKPTSCGNALIEFYLGDYMVSSYYRETLIEDRARLERTGLCLHGGGTYDPSIGIGPESIRGTLSHLGGTP
jgi:hypothetical protein